MKRCAAGLATGERLNGSHATLSSSFKSVQQVVAFKGAGRASRARWPRRSCAVSSSFITETLYINAQSKSYFVARVYVCVLRPCTQELKANHISKSTAWPYWWSISKCVYSRVSVCVFKTYTPISSLRASFVGLCWQSLGSCVRPAPFHIWAASCACGQVFAGSCLSLRP